MTLSNLLRAKIEECELSLSAIERETGVFRQTLMGFMAGHGINLATAEKLMKFFGVEASEITSP